VITSFPPVVNDECKAIILGSMPGIKSLDENEYYAHPRNSFWFIMEKLFKVYSDFEYKQRLKLLLNNKIALWDVIESCERKGSLDSSIQDETVLVNDFADLLLEYQNIKYIFCNGNAAYSAFQKYAMPELEKFLNIEVYKLPSSSPANARMSLDEKTLSWEIIKQKLKEK